MGCCPASPGKVGNVRPVGGEPTAGALLASGNEAMVVGWAEQVLRDAEGEGG